MSLNLDSNKNYDVKWTHHSTTISSSFLKYYEAQKLTDVTLAVPMGNIQCHKIVLSACSAFFEAHFMEHEQATIVMVNDISFATLNKLVEFMYKGEVAVSVEEMKEFFRAGKKLQLKGLVDTVLSSGEPTETVESGEPGPVPAQFFGKTSTNKIVSAASSPTFKVPSTPLYAKGTSKGKKPTTKGKSATASSLASCTVTKPATWPSETSTASAVAREEPENLSTPSGPYFQAEGEQVDDYDEEAVVYFKRLFK